ncbi:MAG: LysR family transcriptional regulator [Streptosporangiales bacterium]|nr:LysR family transcriptional regulator [Streptosporangiales bacterium]
MAVARSLNFTRAAEELHIAQPSLSYTIQQLEKTIGVPLFNRTTRATELTPDGAILFDEAHAVLDRYDAAMERMAQVARGELGRLRVGYLIGAAVDHVPAILRAFADDYPDIQLDLIEYDFSTPNGGLDTGDTDVAIVRPPLDDVPDVITATLLRERCFACLPTQHHYAARPSVTVADLLDESIVAAPGTGAWRDSWILADQRQAPPDITYEAATFEAELQAVAVDRGISIVPETAPRIYARPGVTFVPIADMSDCTVAVARRPDAPQAAANFAETAHRIVRDANLAR